MEILFWILGIVGTVIAYVVGEMIFNRPKIIISSSEGWKETKQVNTFVIRDHSTDTDSYTEKELKSRDYYNVYGIQIRNERFAFSGVNAKLTNVTIKLWDSDGSPLTDWYDGRLWGGRKNASNDPLFPRERVTNEKEIGEGQELDVVLAYNQENEQTFYKFTVETHLQNNFMIYKDLLKRKMPLYGVIRIHGHRITNNKIRFRINPSAEKNILEIKTMSEKEFPLAKEEIA
ncbi:MAG: hypothetical protein HY869_03540 [Chloroflexi bacterium]|nr:hypothetical protein [Chloroflexota bacterium]